jgi:hypothetical protein
VADGGRHQILVCRLAAGPGAGGNLQRESGKDWVLRLAVGPDRAADKADAGAETAR